MVKRVLSIDPGNAAGWCLFEDDKYLKSGGCKGNPNNVKNFTDMKYIINESKPDLVIVETQFINPQRKGKGLMTLVSNRCVWEDLGRLLEAKIIHVDPAKWQAYYGLKPDKTIEKKTERQKDLKKQICAAAKDMVHVEVQENEADAILIGFFVLENGFHKLQELKPCVAWAPK